jgi:hypothetical protein
MHELAQVLRALWASFRQRSRLDDAQPPFETTQGRGAAISPQTASFRQCCDVGEIGAGDGIRTRDRNLGKLGIVNVRECRGVI